MNRRRILKILGGIGIGSAVFQRALASVAQDKTQITPEMIKEAEWISGLELSEEERAQAARSLEYTAKNLKALREVKLTNDVGPAVHFQTHSTHAESSKSPIRAPKIVGVALEGKPATDDEIAYLPITQLAPLIKNRLITSTELTKIYLKRLKKYNPLLNCVVTVTEKLALEQAAKADKEIAAGKYRGPLHGIPWGAKDLIAIPGYPTTWGAPQYEKQKLDNTATVASRLRDAGAVLVAKLSMGALAMGDRWFGGMTRCPWDYKIGSSGSSAGSASAAVAGLVGFTIGTETLGSIISPSRRCGATGLRPTFGRVSRAGCMALSWSMDKVGPITRSIEDCALVFSAIHGADGQDPTARTFDFHWPPKTDLSSLTVGYTKSRTPIDERADIKILKELGVRLKEVQLPSNLPLRAITTVLDIEAAAAFDELTRSGQVEGLNAWPSIFRKASFISGVDYVRAMRVRTLLQREFEKLMSQVDILVNTNDLVYTNLTGHPSVTMPVGFRKRSDSQLPYSAILTGKLNGESDLLTLALAYQKKQTAHLKRPPLDEQLLKMQKEAKEKTAPSQKESDKK